MNEAILAGAIAGAVAGAIAGAAVMIATHGLPIGRGRARRDWTYRSAPAFSSGAGTVTPQAGAGVGTPPTVTPHQGYRGPFDRFNDRAKRVLALAQDEAIRFNHNYIGTEHLLLGLVREGEGVAARALDAMGIELSKVRRAVEFIIGRGDSTTSPSEITLSPRTKKVIELAIDEARRLGHSHVGTEHLLLGLVREGEGIASGVLESLGVSLEAMRKKVMETLGQPHGPTSQPLYRDEQRSAAPPGPTGGGTFDLFDNSAIRALALAEAEATSLNHNWIGTEHLVVGLLRVDEGVAAKALTSLGIELAALRAGLLKHIPRGAARVGSDIALTPRMHEILARASVMRTRRASTNVTPEILLLACVADSAGVGTQVLTELGATPEKIREAVDRLSPPKA